MPKIWSRRRPALGLLLLLQTLSFNPAADALPTPAPSLSLSSREAEALFQDSAPPTRSWIAKVARKLRNGAGLSWDDDVEALLRLSRPEVVEHFMRDPRFLDTVLDFNLFFLGFKPTEVTVAGSQRYATAAYDFPQAISAAQAVAQSGDYFTLFNLKQPYFSPPFGEAKVPTSIAPDTESLSRNEKRQILISSISDYLAQLRASFGTGESWNKEQGCAAFFSTDTFQKLFPATNGFEGSSGVQLGGTAFFTSMFSACTTSALGESFVARAIDNFRQHVETVQVYMDAFDDSRYSITAVTDVKAFSRLEKFELPFDFWSIKTNSSTNFNRKRAAAILKTYFCDDLTPINIAAPETHGSDQHGSDPSCQACHYKLDPMAGFFRDQGIAGQKFGEDGKLVFDDMALITGATYEAYLDSWKVDGAWNVGYIRSLRDPSLNSYERDHAQPIPEMFRIIREAPEVKACLVKRMSEFFISKEQVFDGSFLKGLEKTLVNPGAPSGDNFKAVVRSLMLSQTFAKDNPNARICYDPPAAEAEGARCEVSFIIQTRCAACHAQGFALDEASTRTKMLERLQDSDPERRMPLRMDMPDTERVALIKWLSDAP